MDKKQYVAEEHMQLSNYQLYEPNEINLTGNVTYRVNLHIHDTLLKKTNITIIRSYFTLDIDMIQKFYMLPKIHENTKNPPSRHIVSGSWMPAEKI